MVKVRFAPSPTGYIHIGNARIAYFNWLYALKHKGTFILRYDDTDSERSKQEYIDGIAEDLDWLGIHPAEVAYQSKRFGRYAAVVEDLKGRGLLYPCYETSAELELRRKIRLSRKLPPIYGREALKLTPKEIEKLEAQGRKPHWRFLLPNFVDNPFEPRRTEICWKDVVRGTQTIDIGSMSDPILIREDGSYLYTLPSIVDDIEMGITHILRGDDHITNTGVQLALFDTLGAQRPQFGHINLLTAASGEGLSKRKGTLSIRSLRQEGILPMAIASLAVLIGTSQNVQACATMQELTQHFRLAMTSRSAAKFDKTDLLRLNTELYHQYPYKSVEASLEAIGIKGKKAEAFWYLIRGNITHLKETLPWWDIIEKEHLPASVLFAKKEASFFADAASLLPQAPLDQTSWKIWTDRIKEKTGRKGKELFLPLRQALTGTDHGPELAALLPLLEHDKVLKRLEAVQYS